VEIQHVTEVFDPAVAAAFGLASGQVTVLIHTGSRGLGHQVCTDYVRLFDAKLAQFGITLPDRQLSCAPASSAEGKAYLGAMSAAANPPDEPADDRFPCGCRRRMFPDRTSLGARITTGA
jgi:tRNA-splicing ligase RtcB